MLIVIYFFFFCMVESFWAFNCVICFFFNDWIERKSIGIKKKIGKIGGNLKSHAKK